MTMRAIDSAKRHDDVVAFLHRHATCPRVAPFPAWLKWTQVEQGASLPVLEPLRDPRERSGHKAGTEH